ncbi:hypothetical protein CQA15_29340, partial [Klebsiella pneumoniae]|uniref:hypothetical protein n=1 Tax=Klebsiella pneumoniae TaxID=573 RepID=UPI000BD4188E
RTQHAGRFDAFGLACSQDLKQSLLSHPLSEAERATWQAQAQASLAEQVQIEAAPHAACWPLRCLWLGLFARPEAVPVVASLVGG